MISLGGVIGQGLFLGSSANLYSGGNKNNFFIFVKPRVKYVTLIEFLTTVTKTMPLGPLGALLGKANSNVNLL